MCASSSLGVLGDVVKNRAGGRLNDKVSSPFKASVIRLSATKASKIKISDEVESSDAGESTRAYKSEVDISLHSRLLRWRNSLSASG